MEISFEFIGEAGTGKPGLLGETIGIVGGIILGQAVVSANLISP
jgi:spore germination protein KA